MLDQAKWIQVTVGISPSDQFLLAIVNLESIDDYDMMPPNSVEQSES
ncbi:hypothetical protein [Vibrio sp. 1CM8B]|nr:hypothetical protein [Vibrio sp. 1CM8B]MCK8085472.1 hypothetical protein [Vibrio sp. 1CM8B]